MITTTKLDYEITEYEAEKASNSYLMSLVALIAGLPLPIINLIATLIFYLSNRNDTYFIRWHCSQALLSQLTLFFINTIGVWWTLSLVFTSKIFTDSHFNFSNNYIVYIVFIVIFNLVEFIATIYTAIQTRKGIHVEWWFYGMLTNQICK